MKSFLASVALAATMLTQLASAADWNSDYGDALNKAKAAQKPLLIVIDEPSNPKGRVEQVNFTDDTTQTELLAFYHLCHVDASTPYGQKLAKAFGAKSFPYTAITDKTSKVIIFEKSGSFETQEWVATLIKHHQGERAAKPTGKICFT